MLIKKIFVCEFITGGGLCGEPLPDGLAKEGALMRDALLRDLNDLPYQISTSIDERLAKPTLFSECVVIKKNDDVLDIWQKQIAAADAVFIVAPETDGILHKLTQMANLQGKLVLGCGLDSIKICSEKMATYLALDAANIGCIPTHTYQDWQASHWIWLAKPNDGAGCSDTVCFNNPDDLKDWIEDNHKQYSHVIQAFQPGDAASISCVMRHGKARLLSCNTQIIDINNHKLSYIGGIINGMRDYWPQFEFLANKIAQSLPDLAGYVGIDVIVDDDEIIVVEINPRFTTSYIALRESIAANPAELIINTLINTDFVWPSLQRNMVNVHV